MAVVRAGMAAVVTAVAAVVVSAGVFAAGPVQAAPVVVPDCGPVTSTFSYVEVCNYTGGPQRFVVPAGVTVVGATVDGASGGPDGGLGGETRALLHVHPGEVLTVRVGGRGLHLAAAYGGGGRQVSDRPGGRPGGGGGGSFVDDGHELLLAAGGGGGGEPGVAGGAGSGAGLAAGSGSGSFGGAGATPSGPGVADLPPGQVSGTGPAGLTSFGDGGGGGRDVFQAGGGGYYGGGSGYINGGGGGGGSGYASSDTGLVSGVSGSVGTAPAGDGSVVFSWLGPLAGFVLSPASATIGLGQSQLYTVSLAVDAAGHPVPMGWPTLTISGGTCTGNVCTAPSAGPHTVTATAPGGVRETALLTVSKGATTTTLSANTLTSSPGQTVTFTATVTPVAPATTALVAPTGKVLFWVDGTPAGSGTLTSGVASLTISTLAPGPHTVIAVYGGDPNYLPSTSSTALSVLTGCTQTITGTHPGGLTVTGGSVLCVVSAHVTGGISVGRGSSLFLIGSTVTGSVTASNPQRVQLCASTTSSIAVTGASDTVQIGDPSHGCAPNTIHGAVIATHNHGSVTIIDNTITASLTATANISQTITGNHH